MSRGPRQQPPQRLSPGEDDLDILRMTIFRDEENISPVAYACRQRHRFGTRRRFIEQGSVGNVECGQVGHHRLKIQQRLEPSLRNFRLIRGVLRVPTGILQDTALNYRGSDGVEIPLPKEGAENFVLGGDPPEFCQGFKFAPCRWQIQALF